MALDLARWLPEFPVRERCLYLNHAAVAPLPRRVAEAMRVRIADQESLGSHNWQRWRETELSARALASELVGCRAEDVSLVRSTSEGLSLIAQGLAWRKGDAVLVGDEEFAANVAPYLALQRRGVGVRRFPTPSGRVTPEAVLPLLKPPVRMLALSWVAFHTGWVAPVAELARAAREREIVVVLDAIQGLGVLRDRLDDLGVDAMVADGHKWLLGPEGVGVMVTRPALRSALHPVVAGWLNVRRPDHQLFLHELEFLEDGRRFEPGAMPNILVAGLAAALDLLLEAGIDEVHSRVVSHARSLTQVLLKAGWRVGSPGSGHPIAGIVAGRHPVLPSDDAARRLRERHIEVTSRQGWVRFSPHFYATAGELDALGVILGKL
ncbi:MAG TPA: aminotransferase class V-fold PLP-dependent enzyme [Thermoanaerobaculaceae bacterium]|nr:aminotransferase class V-fold PLP-dependent enzyme [Thermoanaerobaculaceae bacterium]